MSTQLSVMDSRYGFTSEQVDVIKATIAPGATNEELALFLMVCQKTGLDPFSRQIYLSERWSNGVSKKTPETTIDGFRVIAERSGKYAGQLGPFWCGPDGAWRDVWIDNDMPSAAKVGILRADFKEPVWGIALFMEYAQYKKAQGNNPPQLNSMWQKMGANQLAKCAESLGLRKAFPRDLSGMYTREEMAQADKADTEQAKDAQQDVAQRRIKELSAPKTTTEKLVDAAIDRGDGIIHVYEGVPVPFRETGTTNIAPATYVELADSLEAPPAEREKALDAYEQRSATKKQEAAAAIKPVGTPKETRKRGAISFTALKQWGEIKKEILALTGTTDLYYEALKAGGYQHADEIKTQDDAAKIWKALKAITAELSADKKAKAFPEEAKFLEAQTHALRIGPYATKAALERRGLESVEEVLNLAGPELDALLKELRETA